MDEQKQDNQLEPIYNSSVPIQDVALKTYQERWTIEKGGWRGSERSVQHDDDDNDNVCGYFSIVPCNGQRHHQHHHQVALTAQISPSLSLSLSIRLYHPLLLACFPKYIHTELMLVSKF